MRSGKYYECGTNNLRARRRRHGEFSVSSYRCRSGLCLPLRADRAETLRELNSYLASAVCHLLAFVLLGLSAAAVKHERRRHQVGAAAGRRQRRVYRRGRCAAGAEDLGETAAEFAGCCRARKTYLSFKAVATTESEVADVPLESLTAADAPFNDKDVAKQVDQNAGEPIGRGGGGLGEAGYGDGEWTGRGSPSGVEKGFFGIGD